MRDITLFKSGNHRFILLNEGEPGEEDGILTVAEFVESEKILHALGDMGIDYVQGFHLALPRASMSQGLS